MSDNFANNAQKVDTNGLCSMKDFFPIRFNTSIQAYGVHAIRY